MRAERAQDASRRVVVDTNVWISATLSVNGTAATLASKVLDEGVPVFSEATYAELETRLWRPKFDPWLGIELRKQLLHDFAAAAHWVEIPLQLAAQHYCRDPDDDAFIRAALAADCECLVSGDADLLEASPIPGVWIVRPADALRHAGFLGGGD